MTELETMKRAKSYMDKLANGINPIDNTVLPENDIVNNVRISRCLFYVSDILRQMIEGEEKKPKKKEPKEKFDISFEDTQKFPFSNTPISISEIAKRINEINPNENMKKLSHKHITDWLISIEMLRFEERYDGKKTKIPTDGGREMGITTEVRTGSYGEYTAVLYDLSAQQFIIDNIECVIDMISK